MQDRAISTQNFCPAGYLQSVLATFHKNNFPATFGGHLEFLCKTQKRIYLGNGAWKSDFNGNFDPQGIYRLHWWLFPKIAFPPFWGAILILCVNTKVHLSRKWCEIERFQWNFWPTRYLQTLLGNFLKNRFPGTFGGHLEFLRKTQKYTYLGNGA